MGDEPSVSSTSSARASKVMVPVDLKSFQSSLVLSKTSIMVRMSEAREEKMEAGADEPYTHDLDVGKTFFEGLLAYAGETDGEVMTDFITRVSKKKVLTKVEQMDLLAACCLVSCKIPKATAKKIEKLIGGTEIAKKLNDHELILQKGGCARWCRLVPRMHHSARLATLAESWVATMYLAEFPAAAREYYYSGAIVLFADRQAVMYVMIAFSIISSLVYGGAFDQKKTSSERKKAAQKATEGQATQIVRSQAASSFPGYLPTSAIGNWGALTTVDAIMTLFCKKWSVEGAAWYVKSD